MSKKKKQEEVEEEEVAPFWMISFSDLMTLLLSFFVILFSMSTLEKKKVEAVMEAMGSRFVSGVGLRDHMVQRIKILRGDPTKPKVKASAEGTPLTVEPQEKSTTKGAIIPFALESTELDDVSKRILDGLADELQASSHSIEIRGHASNDERTRSVVDDLAYERAWNVRKHLETFGIQHQRFVLVILGPNEPLSPALSSHHMGDANTYVEVIQDPDDPRD